MNEIHQAILDRNDQELSALLEQPHKKNTKTKAALSSVPRLLLLRPKSGSFYSPTPTLAYDENWSFDKGSTPMHFAASIGNLTAIRLLLKNKTRPIQDSVGASPLHLAALGGHLEITKLLLGSIKKVNTPTKVRKSVRFFDAGMTPLMAGLESGNLDLVKLLLEHGADPNLVTDQKMNHAFFATRGGNTEALDLMITYGQSIDYDPVYMNFPLKVAVNYEHLKMVKHLLSLGVPSETSTGNQAPLRLATLQGNFEIRRCLLDLGVRPLEDRGIKHAIRNNDFHYVQNYLAEGGEINGHLWLASALGFLNIVNLLLEKGADINAHKGKGTALHVALENRHWNVAEVLVKYELDCSIVDAFGNSILMRALWVKNAQKDMVNRLLELGANPFDKNKSGVDAFKIAEEFGNLDLLQNLEERKANSVDLSWKKPQHSKTLEETGSSYDWKKIHHALWEELVPPSERASSIQGELIRSAGRLSDEAYRNGNINWGDMHIGFVNFLKENLLDGTFNEERESVLTRAVSALKHHRNPDLSGDGSPLYLVSEAVVDWCLHHRELIEL